MTASMVQDDLKPSDIAPPPPRGGSFPSKPVMIALFVTAATLLAAVVFTVILTAVLVAGTENESGAGLGDPVQTGQAVAISGDIDMEMTVEFIGDRGDLIDRRLANVSPTLSQDPERAVTQGSVELVARVGSPDGITDLYRFETGLLTTGDQETMNCLGTANRTGSSATCRSVGEAEPTIIWGTEDRSIGTWYSVAVDGLPAEAVVLVTETGTMRLVQSSVVDGLSYQEWPAGEGTPGGFLPPPRPREFGEAVRTVALDAEGLVVWFTAGAN